MTCIVSAEASCLSSGMTAKQFRLMIRLVSWFSTLRPLQARLLVFCMTLDCESYRRRRKLIFGTNIGNGGSSGRFFFFFRNSTSLLS